MVLTAAYLAALAFLAFISLGLPDGLLGVAWPSIRESLGVPLDALGLLVGFSTAGYLLSSFISGRVLRVMSVGAVLTVSTVLAASALLGFALTRSWPLLIGLGFVAGLAGGAIDAGLNSYGAKHFSARVLNWLHASFGVGTTLGPLIVTAVLSSGGVWRLSYAIVGAAQMVLALVFFLTRRRWLSGSEGVSAHPYPRQEPSLGVEGETPLASHPSSRHEPSVGVGEERPQTSPPKPARTRDTLRKPIVWLGMLTFFVYAGVEMVTGQWAFSLLTIERGVAVGAAGLLVSLFWGSLMVGRVVFGIVADRVNLTQTLRLCIAACVVGALLFWLEPTRALSYAGMMLIGFSIAPIFASLISLTPARVGKEHADNAIGFQIASAGLGGAGLTAAVGLASRAYGLEVVGATVLGMSVLLFVLFQALTGRGAATRA